jgi:hypothetical protein
MQPPNLLIGAKDGTDVVRESNHRIANNLMTIATLLRYQSRQLTKISRSFSADEVRDIFNDAGQRIELVSRLHRRLAEPISPKPPSISCPSPARSSWSRSPGICAPSAPIRLC